MEGIKYLTDEKGKRVAIQIDLSKHKKFVEEYLEFVEDRKDIKATQFEETIPFEEVISKYEKLHGKNV
ncbi:MAG: hypothetical protein J7L95_07680 [Prolixibacteraceae bacterium]|nr:hypothetical protein [Prolixibacteraceae bacterium]